jgi:hypothetical protein
LVLQRPEGEMPRIAAMMIDRVTRSLASSDGRHVVLQARTADGEDISFAIPREQIDTLIDHCAFGASQSEEILRSGLDLRTAVRWWNSALDRESGGFRLALTFGSGGTVRFDFSEHMARALLATLRGSYEADAGGPCPSDESVEPGFVDID